MKAFAIALLASIALPVVAHAGEQNLEFKFVVKPIRLCVGGPAMTYPTPKTSRFGAAQRC